MTKIWVLTRSHNDYNQHGNYFVAAFRRTPELEQLIDFIRNDVDYSEVADLLKFLLHLKKGGGRLDSEDVWFNLEQIDLN